MNFAGLFKEDILSLDAEPSAVRAVHASVSPSGFEIKKAVVIAPDHIEDSLRFHFPGVRRILLSVHDSDLFVRKITVPETRKNRIREILPFEAEGVLPLPLEESETVFTVSESGETETKVICYAASKHILRERISVIPEAEDFRPGLLVPESAALASLIRYAVKEEERENLLLQIHCGASHSVVSIFRSGELIFTRTVSYGMRDLISSAAETLKTEEREAEYAVRQIRIVFPEETPDTALRPDGLSRKQFNELYKIIYTYWSSFAEEVRRTLLAAETGIPERLYMSGDYGSGAAEFLSQYFDMAYGAYDYSRFSMPDAATYAGALGILIHYSQPVSDRTDFLSTAFGRTLRRGEFHPESLRFPGMLTAAGILFLVLAFVTGLIRDRRDMALLRKEITVLAASIPGVNPNADPVAEARKICSERLASYLNQSEAASVLQLLKEISDRMPGNEVPFRISSLRFDEKDAEIEAEMDRLTDVTTLENSLRESQVFSRVEVKSEARADRKVRVRINLLIKSSASSAGRNCI